MAKWFAPRLERFVAPRMQGSGVSLGVFCLFVFLSTSVMTRWFAARSEACSAFECSWEVCWALFLGLLCVSYKIIISYVKNIYVHIKFELCDRNPPPP